VLFGFQDGENLFLKADGWDAPEIPLMIERQPFLIGRNGEEMLVHVDLDSPRVRPCGGRRRGRSGVPAAWRHHRIPGTGELGLLYTIHEGFQSNAGLRRRAAEIRTARIVRARHRARRRFAEPAGRLLHVHEDACTRSTRKPSARCTRAGTCRRSTWCWPRCRSSAR
jgi:hypothetical protein